MIEDKMYITDNTTLLFCIFVQHVANKMKKTLDSFLLQKCVNLSLLIQHYKTIAEKCLVKHFVVKFLLICYTFNL